MVNNKVYIIPYEFEKLNLIKSLHEKSFHKGINILDKLIREVNFGGILFIVMSIIILVFKFILNIKQKIKK